MDANKYKTNYERMLELIRRLKDADIAYYRDDNPVMILSIIVGTFSSNIHTLMRSYLRSHSTAAS